MLSVRVSVTNNVRLLKALGCSFQFLKLDPYKSFLKTLVISGGGVRDSIFLQDCHWVQMVHVLFTQ